MKHEPLGAVATISGAINRVKEVEVSQFQVVISKDTDTVLM